MSSTVAALLVLAGAIVACIGSFGLLRLRTFQERVHPPTMGATLGTALVLAGSIVRFTASETGLAVQAVVIAIVMLIGTPVTYMLLVRAATRRDDEDGMR